MARLLQPGGIDALVREFAGRYARETAAERPRAGAIAAGRVEVRSAGTEPAGQVDSNVADVLAQTGVPLEGAFPEPLTDEVVRAADVVITMGCGDACPVLPGRHYLDWDLPDPAGADHAAMQQVAPRIAAFVQDLLADLVRQDPR